jgi:outer membrane OprD family porin
VYAYSAPRAVATIDSWLAALLSLSFGITAAAAQEVQGQDSAATPASTSASLCTQEPSTDTVAPLTSTEQGQTPMDQSFECITPEEWAHDMAATSWRDTTFNAQLRSFYMDSKNLSGTENEAWALGGSAGFKTGFIGDLVAFGATAYTSQRLYGPEDKDGTRLLAPGQKSYSVLGEAYGEIPLTEGVTASVGLQGISTPYIGLSDVRMTPNTFEAAFVQGALGGANGAPSWRFGAGYVDKIKQRNSDEFESMATAAGAPPGVERGVWAAGATFRSGGLSIGGIDYYSSDIINIAYVEAKQSITLSDRLRMRMSVQYTDQRSVGDNLLTGHEFSANQVGLKAELLIDKALLLTTGYTGTGTGATLRSPWALGPSYSSVQQAFFNRSGEDAWLLRVAYNFPWAENLKNLSAYVMYVHGSQPDEPNQYARKDWDFQVQWKPPTGKLEGLIVLVRFGYLTEDSPTAPHAEQLRLILYYTPPGL